MFVLNQLLGTVLVHPDIDTYFQWCAKMAMLMVTPIILIYLDDTLLGVSMTKGF